MTPLFKSPAAKAGMERWFEKFRARLPATESRVVPTRFGDTHLLVGGPKAAPSLVLLHGAMASSAHVLGELTSLLERFRVYAIDIVGQSVKSAEARPAVSNDDYGVWLEEVLDALGLERPHVVGVSWGGFVAIRLAAHAPGRIGRLALLVPAGVVKGSFWAGFKQVGWPMLMYQRFPSPQRLDAFTRNLLTTTDDDWKPYLGEAFLAYRMDMRIPPLATKEELATFSAPTLVVAADGDVSFPGHALLARATELFPSLAGTELLENCRHSPPTTDTFRRWLGERLSAFFLPA